MFDDIKLSRQAFGNMLSIRIGLESDNEMYVPAGLAYLVHFAVSLHLFNALNLTDTDIVIASEDFEGAL